MPKPRVSLRIGVVQFSPKIGQVQANLAKARELCKRIQPRSLDLLCFPEMAFTGYVFESASAISPYLEHPRTGPTSQFCAELAKKLQCYVIAGYPERLSPDEQAAKLDSMTENQADLESQVTSTSEATSTDGAESRVHSQTTTTEEVGANAAALYGPDGEWVGGYRKTHLFVTDKTWAKPGTGFTTFTLPSPLLTLSLGICMDLNPLNPNWTLAGGPYELADYALSTKTNVLILLNAWLDSRAETEEVYDWQTLNYWAARLRPLWLGEDAEGPEDEDEDAKDQEAGTETVVVICNRNGEENGKLFAGTSAIFSMVSGSGRPKLLDMMERREEGVRIWNIQV